MISTRYLTTSALVAIVAGGPAAADLTAEQVWGDWQALASSFGQTIRTTGEVRTSDALTIRGFSTTIEMPEEGGSVTGTLDEIIFTERSDGTVAITLAPSYPFSLDMTSPEGEQINGAFEVTHTGLTLVASGEVGNTRYDYLAPEMRFVVNDFAVDGETFDLALDVAMNALGGSYAISEGVPRQVASDFRADALTASMQASDPEGGEGSVDFSLSMSDIEGTSNGTAMDFAAMTMLSEMLSAGFETESRVTYGAMTYELSGADGAERFNVAAAAEGGDFDVSIGPEGVTYGGGNTGLTVAVSGSEIPLPQLSFRLAESEGRLQMPIAASDDAQDFGLFLRLVDLEIDDFIWGLFDPAGALGRDPATVVLDLSGAGRWLIDITDPEAAVTFVGESPGEIEEVTLNRLEVRAVETELTGSGAFTFDNTDLETFDGLPAPTGAIDLTLVGANGLLDKLVGLGLLPEDQAMGARMMLGLFARPGEGPDTLTSKIEVSPDGGVLANGQRIR